MKTMRSEKERIERKIHILEVDYENLQKGANKKLEQIKALQAKREKLNEGDSR